MLGSRFILDLPSAFSDSFANAFNVRLVQQTTESWESFYGMLEQYKEEVGDMRVPRSFLASGGEPRGTWVGTQRYENNLGRLSKDRISKLKALGFIWDDLETRWQNGYEILKRYKEKNGNCEVPFGAEVHGFKLADWISTNRRDFKNGKLAISRVELLNELGFVWNPLEQNWNSSYKSLENYKAQYGDCLVPANHIINDIKLGTWVKISVRSLKRIS